MRYKKYLGVLFVSVFAISALMFSSVHSASAGFWDWFGIGGVSQQATVEGFSYKWINNGLVSESSGRNTGTCAKLMSVTYTCSSYNVGSKLYDGTNRGASYGDVGHAWPIYEGENTSVATEYTYAGCGLDKRTGGQVNQWECKAVTIPPPNFSSSSAIPTVQTSAAANVTSNHASLSGIVDPKGKSVKVYFEIFPDPNGGSYGMMTPQQSLASPYVQSFGADVSNLKPGTTYTYFANVMYVDSSTGANKVIKDTVGKTFTTMSSSSSSVSSASTSIPTVLTKSATSITGNSATLNGTVDPKDKTSKTYFEIFPDPNGGSYGMLTPQQTAVNYYGVQDFSFNLTNLKPGMIYTYYARVTYYDSTTGTNKVIKDTVGKTFTTSSLSSSSSISGAPVISYLDPQSTAAGGIVYIQGYNFDQYSYVVLDSSVSVSPFSITQNTIGFIVPIGTSLGSHTVQVAQKAGNSPLSNSALLKIVNSSSSSSSSAMPYLTVLAPSGGQIIKGANIIISWTLTPFSNHDFGINLLHSVDQSTAANIRTCGSMSTIATDGSRNFSYGWEAGFDSSNREIPNGRYVVFVYDCGGKTTNGLSQSGFDLISANSFSSSSTSAGLTAITGNADYSSTNATLYGIVNNPNREEVYYYFNYRKETESSSQTKQTLWLSNNNAFSSSDVSARISDLSPGTKYVYRLYAYSQATQKTVSGDLKSFTTPSNSSSLINSGGQTYSYTFTRELGYGSSGSDVTELQKRLTSEGYYSGPITGYYGSMTVESVKKYQMGNGLTVTGYVGPQTLGILNGSTVNSTSVSSSSQGTSLSQLVELFIALGIISPDKAELARSSVKGM